MGSGETTDSDISKPEFAVTQLVWLVSEMVFSSPVVVTVVATAYGDPKNEVITQMSSVKNDR